MTGDASSLGGLVVLGLEADDPRIETDLYPLLRQLRPHLTPRLFDALIAEGYPQGLRYLVAYRGHHAPQAAAGYRVIATSRGRILFLDDLVTDPGARSGGIGAALLDAVETIGQESGCTAIELDSGLTNAAAHRFYFAQRMTVTAFHFAASLAGPE